FSVIANSILQFDEDKEEEKEQPTETSSSSVFTEELPIDMQENKTDVGMDVNAVEVTSPTPTEPVIVVDNTSDDASDNSIKAELKDEVKSSAASVVLSSTLFFAFTSMLLI
uniref:Ovule protein n=1 Tax=Angiostrongylus cantonensis TaxID=6313 RepID=A0A0K0DD49_ANGCA